MKYLALILILTSFNSLAIQEPKSSVFLEYSPAEASFNNGYITNIDTYQVGHNMYFTNNLSTRFSFGMGKGSEPVLINDTNSNETARLKYMISLDLRYELPFTNSFSTYAFFGATSYDLKTENDILNIREHGVGLKAGFGISYVMSKNTAIYTEVKQDVFTNNFEIESYSIGFKYAY